MENFKEGDKIICIDNSGFSRSLTIGKTYTIVGATYLYRNSEQLLIERDDMGNKGINFLKKRFVSETKKELINLPEELFKL